MTYETTGLPLRSTHDLLVAVPYMLGFQPDDSAVLIGLDGPKVVFAARADLPPPDDHPAVRRAAQHLASVAERQPTSTVVIVGYGPPRRVDPAMLELHGTVEEAGLCVYDVLRVTGHRFWSYLCDGCCPEQGVALDPACSEVAAAATVAGMVALPDRASFERLVEPDAEATSEPIREATGRIEARVRETFGSEDTASARHHLVRRGRRLLDAALPGYARGERLDTDGVAWLSVLLLVTDFAELVWQRMLDHPGGHYLALWRDLVRRVRPDLCAPVATLLGYAAWRTGDGGLAGLAVRRALRESPDYEPARVLQAVLHSGVGPEELTATVLARRSHRSPPGYSHRSPPG